MHKREHRSNLKRNAYPDSHPQSRQPVNDVFPYYDDDKYVGRYERNTWNSIQRRRDLLRNDRYKRGLDLTDYNSDNDFGVRSVKVMPRSRTGVQNVPGDRYARRIRPQKCNAPINGDLLAKEYDYLGFKKSELSKPDINEGKKNIIPESVEQAQGNNNIEIKTTTNKDEVDTGTRDKRAVKVNIIDDNNIIESVKHDDKNHAMLLTIANKNNVERRDTSDKNTVIQILKETAPKVLHDLLMPLEQQPDFLGKVHNAFQILQDSTENSKRVSLLDVDQPTSAIEQHELSTKVADREDSGGWPFNGARDIQESTMFTTKSCDNFKVVEAVNMIHDKSKAEQPTKVKSGAYNEDSGQEEKVNQYDDESDDGYLSRRLKSVDYGVDLDYENGDKNNGSKIRVKRNFLEASSDYILRKDRSEDDYDEDSDPGGKKIIYDIIKKDQTKLISPLKEFAEKEMFAPINYDSKFARCDKCGENSGQCTCNHEKGSEKCSTCGENCKNCGTESTGSSTIASFNVLDIPEASSVKLSQLENLPDKNTLQQVIHQKEKEIKEKLGVMESEKIGKPKFFSEAPNILPSNHNKNDLHHSPPSTTLINEDQPEIEMAVNPAEVSSEPASESYMNTPENSDKGKDDETNDGELLNSVDSFSSIVEDSEKKINKRNLISESPLIRNVPYDRFTKVNKLWRPQYPINKLKDIINVRKVRSNSDSKSVQGKCKTPGAAKSKANKNMKQWTGAAGQPSRKGKTALSLEKGLNPNLGLKSINEGESGGCAPVADKSTAGDMHDVLNGKLPSAIVERVFNKIAEHPTLKTRFGLGLRRTHNYKTQMKNLDEFRNSETEEDIRRTEEMLGEILGLLNKIVLDQVHRRTCKRLSPELKDYLKELTGEKGNAEDDEQRTKINDEGMPLPLVKGTKIKTGSTPAPQGDFLFPNPDGSSPLQASEEKIKGKIKMIKELLEQYQKMSGHCKTKVEDIEAYLKKHLRTLNLMLKAIRAEDAAAAHASLKKCHPTKTKRKFVDTKSTSNTDDKSSTIRKSDSKYSDLVDRQLDSIGLGPKKTYKPTFSIDQIIHDKMRKMQPPKEQPHSPKKRSDEGDYYEHKSEHKRDLSNSGDVSDKYKKLVEAADTYRKKRESEERLGKLFGNTNAVKENLSPEHKDSSRFNEVGFEKPVMFSLDK